MPGVRCSINGEDPLLHADSPDLLDITPNSQDRYSQICGGQEISSIRYAFEFPDPLPTVPGLTFQTFSARGVVIFTSGLIPVGGRGEVRDCSLAQDEPITVQLVDPSNRAPETRVGESIRAVILCLLNFGSCGDRIRDLDPVTLNVPAGLNDG